MSYYLHPAARSHLKFIKPFSIVANFNYGVTNKVNTNPYLLDYSLYPDLEHTQLKFQFLKYLSSSQMKLGNLDVNNLLFTAGASEAIELVIKSFCEPAQDIVCVTPPTFSLYEDLSKRHNCSITKVNLLGANFESLNVSKILTVKPKVVFLCSPNNPVGTMLSYVEVERLLVSVTDSLVVMDETYIDFATDQNLLPLIEKYSNFVIIRSFSKSWGLAGIRAGIVIANNIIINTLKLIQLPYSFSSLAQESILSRITNTIQISQSIQQIIKERDRIHMILKNEVKDITKIYPSFTNFITACFINHSAYLKLLKQHHMLVTDIDSLIPCGIRLSIYNEKYNDQLISIIQKVQRSNE